jgi:Spy/CpxP family protein refolding chaperone
VLGGSAGLAILAISAAPLHAQQQQHRQRGMDPEQRMQVLQEKLVLTDEQAVALEPIFAQHDEKRRELFESRSGERQAMREQMQALRGELDAGLAEVLTAEQMASFRGLREEKRQSRRQGQGKRRGPPTDG